MFKETIKEKRLELNLSLRELESLTGISNAYISLLETGARSVPTLKTILKLADALKIDHIELIKIAIKEVKDEAME